MENTKQDSGMSFERAENLLEQKQIDRSPKKKKSKRTKLVLICILAVVLIGLVINAFSEVEKMGNPTAPIEEQIEDVEIHFYLITFKLDVFFSENGHYPTSLKDEIEDEGVDYFLNPDGSYTLQYVLRDTVLTYCSTEDRNRLLNEEFLREVVGEEDISL